MRSRPSVERFFAMFELTIREHQTYVAIPVL